MKEIFERWKKEYNLEVQMFIGGETQRQKQVGTEETPFSMEKEFKYLGVYVMSSTGKRSSTTRIKKIAEMAIEKQRQ